MTGIEAVSHAVPVFRDVQWRNARTTLTWMVSLLLVLFGALLLLIRIDGLVPTSSQTMLSELASTRHLLIALVLHLDLPSLQALEYAASLRAPVLALHVSTEESDAQRFRQGWDQWGAHVPLEVVVSPYRAVAGPIVNYIEALHAQRPDLMLTVVLPVIKVRRPWQRPLHSRLGDHLRRALERHRGIAVTEVPFHLPA